MAEKFLALVLYPALADGLSTREQQTLKEVIEGMEEVEPAEVIEVMSQRISAEEMAVLADQVADDQKQHYYSLAKQIASAEGLSIPEKLALKELAAALNITGDEDLFYIPKHEAGAYLKEDEQNFFDIAKKFSMVAGAIGFLPRRM